MNKKEDPKPKEKKPETPPKVDDKPQQDDKKGFTLIEEANKAAERLEQANEVRKDLLDRQEQLQAETTLAGRSVNTQSIPKPADPLEDPKNYANEVMKGNINPLVK